jgi:fibro-slime domain-containing protein
MIRRLAVLGALGLATVLACGDQKVTTGGGGAATGGSGKDGKNGYVFTPSPGAGSGASGGGSSPGGEEECGVLTATVRDFMIQHPDFEDGNAPFRGLVKVDLGPDHKPVYAPAGPTIVTSGQEAFDQWYRDVPGVNMSATISLPLSPAGPGIFVYDNSNFFPLDGKGFGNEGLPHNYHFTTEIHASFKYRGGERFTFRGDDDVFAFVNGKLALDLGGVHGVETGTIDFDAQAAALGITKGETYPLDVFHAERHTTRSNFRIETSIECLRSVVP